MISSVAGVEKEGKKEEKNQPSLRYLATQILFKGYCIIFLMRFPLPPVSFSHRRNLMISPVTSTKAFRALQIHFRKKISKIMQVVTFISQFSVM